MSVSITAGIGTPIDTDVVGGNHQQIIRPAFGVAGVGTMVAAATPFPMQPGLKLTEQCSRAAISCATPGDNIIVALSGTTLIHIFALMFTVATPVGIKIGDSTTAYYTGVMTFGSGGGLFLAQQGEPHFITASGKNFILNLSAAVQVSGCVWYQQS